MTNPVKLSNSNKRRRRCVSNSPDFNTYRKVLLKVLYGNCQTYSWFQDVLRILRDNNWSELYAWADRAVTDVYSTAEEHFAIGQLAALIRKYPWDWKMLGFEHSPEETAKMTFLASEQKCRKINRLFPKLKRTPYAFHLEYMRRWVHHVLGDVPNLKQIYSECSFGPGANIGVHGNKTNIYRKLFAKDGWTVSNAAKPYASGALKINNNLSLHLYEKSDSGYYCFDAEVLDERIKQRMHVVPYNQLSFVPKTAKTHRVIAVEPLLNSFIQKGIDQVMRKKLRSHGYDLGDQERNKYLAKLGSETGRFATMDLSSASDSISIELVKYLLPSEWMELLDRTRSGCYLLDKEVHPYAKFCSMGNGFCFPLETLIFAAACRAAMHASQVETRTHAVYGDDIVVPLEAYGLLKRILGAIGFTVNSRKSFNTGPFRESCGADWYEGQDVRPVYLDYILKGEVSFRVFHNVTLRSQRTKLFFEEIRPFLRKQVPEKRRFLRPILYRVAGEFVPRWLSNDENFLVVANLNGAFDVELDEFMSSRWAHWKKDQFRWSWREVVYTPRFDSSPDPLFRRARYLAFLSGSPEGRLALRRQTRPSVVVK